MKNRRSFELGWAFLDELQLGARPFVIPRRAVSAAWTTADHHQRTVLLVTDTGVCEELAFRRFEGHPRKRRIVHLPGGRIDDGELRASRATAPFDDYVVTVEVGAFRCAFA